MPGRKVVLIGVPLDWGAAKRGAAGGPAAIRRADLQARLEGLGLAVEDLGDVPVPAGVPKLGSPKLRYGALIRKVCEELASRICAAVKQGAVPVTLGGDHSLAVGSVSGVAKRFRERGQAIGLLWVDAHGDINTPETSPSGNAHGMPVAHLLGLGDRLMRSIGGFSPKVQPARTVLVGVRDVDASERANLRRSGVRVFTMADIDRHGMARVMEQALEYAGQGAAGIHVSFDIDAADPSIAQGTGTPKRGGLTYREAHLLMEMLAESGKLSSLDLAEVNPLEDSHNTTAELASELIQSAFGKRIY